MSCLLAYSEIGKAEENPNRTLIYAPFLIPGTLQGELFKHLYLVASLSIGLTKMPGVRARF